MDGSCSLHESLSDTVKRMDAKLDAIIASLGTGSTAIAKLELRVGILEKVVYGAVGLVLLTIIGAAMKVLLGH